MKNNESMVQEEVTRDFLIISDAVLKLSEMGHDIASSLSIPPKELWQGEHKKILEESEAAGYQPGILSCVAILLDMVKIRGEVYMDQLKEEQLASTASEKSEN